MPLAATGIIGLGLVPTLGGPEQPLHWAVTLGLVGCGVLLWMRRRLRGPEPALGRVSPEEARHAGRVLFIVCGVVGALVALIVGARLRGGEPLAPFSVALPVLGLAWLATLGVQVLRHREPPLESPQAGDRPSRRPRELGRRRWPPAQPQHPARAARQRMKRPSWLLAVSAVALGLGSAPRLWAELPPGHDDGPRESHEQRLRQRLERLREHAAGLASSFPRLPSSAEAAPPGSAAAPSSARALELARKWAEQVATRHERRERHRAELARELGARLSDPAVLVEVKLHATRQAELERAKFLALNARHGADRDRILSRIAKLSERENTRHRSRIEKLLGRSSAASAPSGAAPPASAPPSTAPSAGGPR